MKNEDDQKLSILRYGKNCHIMKGDPKLSGPVRVGDTIKELLKDWKFDPIPKDDSAL